MLSLDDVKKLAARWNMKCDDAKDLCQLTGFANACIESNKAKLEKIAAQKQDRQKQLMRKIEKEYFKPW